MKRWLIAFILLVAAGLANAQYEPRATTATGDALVANPLSQFAATTSSQFKGVISDENAPDGASSKVIMALGSLSIASGKTATFSNILTFTGTDSSSIAFGAGGTAAYTDVANTFTGANIISTSGAASAPSLKISGVPFAGTGTTSFPLVYINDANATASTSLNTAGTYLGINIDGTQDGINILKDGSSVFKVASGGSITSSGIITLSLNNGIAWASGGGFYSTSNGFWQLFSSGFSQSVGLRITTNNLLEVRNSGNTGAGIISAEAFVAAGTATSCTGATIGSGSKNNAGFVTATGTGTSTIVITFSVTAATGWVVMASNGTTVSNLIPQTASSTTTATIVGTTVTGDTIRYLAMPY